MSTTASTAPGTTPKKSFVPLECNPELMTTLIHRLGVSRSLSFVDVYSLTDPDLLAFVPRPALALLLVFPVSASYEEFRQREDAERPDRYPGHGEGEDPVWFKQTIKNACGLIGVLHATANGDARAEIQPNTPLADFLATALPLPMVERALALENSSSLSSAHLDAASKGCTAPPSAEENVELHYVCLVKSVRDNHLYELDGRRKGPLDRGYIGEEDVLCDEARRVVQSFVEREKESGRLDFSLVALVED